MIAQDLLVWEPDRDPRYPRVAGPPRDNEGQLVTLFDGSNIACEYLVFEIDKVRGLPDFVYDQGLLLLASKRAWKVISAFRVDGVRPINALIRHKGSEADIADFVWLNLTRSLPLLDRQRSRFSVTKNGVFREIAFFAVREDVLIHDDLFVCEEMGAHIFTQELAAAVNSAGLTGAVFRKLDGSSWPR